MHTEITAMQSEMELRLALEAMLDAARADYALHVAMRDGLLAPDIAFFIATPFDEQPVVRMAKVALGGQPLALLDLVRRVAEGASSAVECNCGDVCERTCLKSEADALIGMIGRK